MNNDKFIEVLYFVLKTSIISFITSFCTEVSKTLWDKMKIALEKRFKGDNDNHIDDC
ncbi:MAG: hypothetical protein LBR30_06505 [Clostridioides sp.]|nr:hypothetical protein [Clostridioides sp.]